VATEQHSSTGDPDEPDRVINAEDSLAMFDHYVAGRLPLRRSVVKAARCWYTMAPQSRFIIDRHPQHDNVLIASPCSGHGFKHSAAVGEALARLLAGAPPRINLLPFGIEYFPGVGRY
jgi:sarcosine oxidase